MFVCFRFSVHIIWMKIAINLSQWFTTGSSERTLIFLSNGGGREGRMNVTVNDTAV